MSNHLWIWMVVMVAPDGTKTVIKSGLNRFRAVQAERELNRAAASEGFGATFAVERRKVA
jgi:hypothetical protein